MDDAKNCIYCKVPLLDDNFLKCKICTGIVHIKCLKHACTPGDILGDVFFNLTCANCVAPGEKEEKLERQCLPWMAIIMLTLYNLAIKSKGLSHHGYFHWRTHIISFVDKNWKFFFKTKKPVRKKILGTVSGTLSHNSPAFFLSGQELFKESGWWKLANDNQTPRYIFNLYLQRIQIRHRKRRELLESGENSNSSETSSNEEYPSKRVKIETPIENSSPESSCARIVPYMGQKPKEATQPNIVENEMSNQALNSVQSSLMDFLAESLGGDDLSVFNSLPNITPGPLESVGKVDLLMSPTLLESSESLNLFDLPESLKTNDLPLTANEEFHGKLSNLIEEQQWSNQAPLINVGEASSPTEKFNDTSDVHVKNEENEDETYEPRIVQVTNFQQIEQNKTEMGQADSMLTKIKYEIKSEDDTSDDETENVKMKEPFEPCKPSLFKKTPCRKWPWLVEPTSYQEELSENLKETARNNENVVPSNERLTHMSLYEEQQLHQKLQYIYAFEQQNQIQIPACIRRFYRKLCVRKWKREHNRPIFNLDDHIDPNGKPVPAALAKKREILDRYQLIALSSNNSRKSFYARIAGSSEYELFESPYTQRILHPFIFRAKETTPPWLKLMCEIKQRVTGQIPNRASIDYCYVRPYHIAAVNALLQTSFWPGIDMSECLSYPDYSVVALYRKLVIGCGFLVPDVGYNEAYISFMAVRPGWQRSGIATFMLYHLIQTCMSKDITLHVSATNPAVMLYQKFGFKIEEIIFDFYDKYLPIDSNHSRHALLLRLMR